MLYNIINVSATVLSRPFAMTTAKSVPKPCCRHTQSAKLSCLHPHLHDKWHDVPFSQCGLHVYEPLVAAATEQQLLVAQRFDEWTIYKHVDQLYQLALCRLYQLLIAEARITPNGFLGSLVYGQCQFKKSFGLVHGVAPAEGYVGVRVGLYHAHNVLGGHVMAAVEAPRLRIMTAGAGMAATGTIDAGTEAGTIDHSVLQDVKHTYHKIFNVYGVTLIVQRTICFLPFFIYSPARGADMSR